MTQMIVETAAGKVCGTKALRAIRFLGVPYAAAPVGVCRFALPQQHEPWSGIRDASAAGPTAPQRLRPFPGLNVTPVIGPGWVEGDDFLSLNIWRPVGSISDAPVMVFIHGGGFVNGAKDASATDGSAFARDGVILVAVNYRLGVEGFLPIPGIPTNLGLRDQIAALQWVRDNVAGFGGDPNNVTLFGESAGGMSVASLMTSPLAKGLFRRVIVQSGHGAVVRDIAVARRLVTALADRLAIGADAESFAAVPLNELLDAVEQISLPTAQIDLRDDDGHEPMFGISRFAPVVGDDVLPDRPIDALRRGVGADIDLLIGTNAEEMSLYLTPAGIRESMDFASASERLGRSYKDPQAVLCAYGADADEQKAGGPLISAMTDLVFRWPARRFAEEHRGRTHVYEFDWRSPQFEHLGGLGAAHAIELAFVFDTLSSVSGLDGLCGVAPPQPLADRMHRIWLDFARDGSLPWGAFSDDDRRVYVIEQNAEIEEPPMPAAAFLL